MSNSLAVFISVSYEDLDGEVFDSVLNVAGAMDLRDRLNLALTTAPEDLND